MPQLNFLCIGIQKSGTTSLINYLNSHPQIYMHKHECHFFDTNKNNIISDIDIKNYEDLFQTNKLIIGEKTPSYSYLYFAIDRIFDYNKNMKLILILREPISRAYSEYNMNAQQNNYEHYEDHMVNEVMRNNDIKLTNINSNGCYYIVRGYYDEIIKYILGKFSKDQLYIGISEEIKLNKFEEYNKIYNFLGTYSLNKLDEKQDTHIRNYNRQMPSKLEKDLYNIYKPHNEKLYEILGRIIDLWEQYYIGINPLHITS